MKSANREVIMLMREKDLEMSKFARKKTKLKNLFPR